MHDAMAQLLTTQRDLLANAVIRFIGSRLPKYDQYKFY